MQAARRNAVLLGRIAFFIAGAEDEAALDAAAREDGGENERMVATTATLEGRLTAELGSDDDQGAVEEAASIEVLDQGRIHAVEIAADFFHSISQRCVHIPAADGDLDEADAVLDETTGQQATLTELALAVARPRGRLLRGEVERFEVGALHELEGGLVEFVVRLDALVRRLAAEAGVKLREQAGTFIRSRLGHRALGIAESVRRIEDRQRRIGRGEPAVAMIRRPVDGHRGGQGLMARTQEVLRPGPEGRVLESAALFEAGAHQVGGRGMHADLGGHGADDGDPVADLGGLREIRSQLHVALGGDD